MSIRTGKPENGGNIARPTITVLDRAQMEQIHEQSLQILSSVGVRVDSEQAVKRFAQAAGAQAVDGKRVYIPAELVNWALEVAPSSLGLYNRKGEQAFHLPGEARFGIGVTALYYQDPVTDDVTAFSRRHMETMVRLGDALPSFDCVSTVGIVQDVDPHVLDLYATLEMTANTTKPLVILVSDESSFPAVLDMLEHLHGDLASQPFTLPYFNPISPLVINEGTVEKMLVAIDRGLPFIYSNYGMAGASTPITPGGALVLMNAELLAGLTLSQVVREGTPVVLGSLPSYFDMKGMGSFYEPRSYLLDLACAEMMAFYGLPHCGTSGSGAGWGPDLISAGHQWTNHLVSCLGKVGLAPFVGDILGSMAFSPASAVYANAVIEQARIIAQGMALDSESVALDEIAEVGPGGNFLVSRQTLQLFRSACYRSDILPNLVLEEWKAQSQPRAEEVLRHRTQGLLDTLAAPQDHDDLMARGTTFIEQAR